MRFVLSFFSNSCKLHPPLSPPFFLFFSLSAFLSSNANFGLEIGDTWILSMKQLMTDNAPLPNSSCFPPPRSHTSLPFPRQFTGPFLPSNGASPFLPPPPSNRSGRKHCPSLRLRARPVEMHPRVVGGRSRSCEEKRVELGGRQLFFQCAGRGLF